MRHEAAQLRNIVCRKQKVDMVRGKHVGKNRHPPSFSAAPHQAHVFPTVEVGVEQEVPSVTTVGHVIAPSRLESAAFGHRLSISR